MTRIHCLQHVPFEEAGYILTWSERCGHRFSVTRLYANDPYPKFDQFDLLIIMGGPMSVYDENKYRWMREEKIFIRTAIQKKKTMLGVCLGAQLIADAMNARIYTNTFPEIGWFPIQRAPEITSLPLGSIIPSKLQVFHWHGETFDLPYQAIRLASSQACVNQGFLVNERIIGLQCHLETRWEDVDRIVSSCGDDIIGTGQYIQAVEAIIYEHRYFTRMNEVLAGILNYLISVTQRNVPKKNIF